MAIRGIPIPEQNAVLPRKPCRGRREKNASSPEQNGSCATQEVANIEVERIERSMGKLRTLSREPGGTGSLCNYCIRVQNPPGYSQQHCIACSLCTYG